MRCSRRTLTHQLELCAEPAGRDLADESATHEPIRIDDPRLGHCSNTESDVDGARLRRVHDRPVAAVLGEELLHIAGAVVDHDRVELGPVGTDGVVRIEDVAPRAYASTGVRGSYSEAHHREGLERVEKWITTQSTWQADGPSRYLGYNSPFVPWFWRYGEVQVPVVPASTPEP